MLSEFELIARYFTRAPRHTTLAVGDDAALLSVSAGCELAASTDMLVEGVHFFPDVDPQALGHKALAVNLSDLPAMGATPPWGMVSLALPAGGTLLPEGIVSGFLALAGKHGGGSVGRRNTRGTPQH